MQFILNQRQAAKFASLAHKECSESRAQEMPTCNFNSMFKRKQAKREKVDIKDMYDYSKVDIDLVRRRGTSGPSKS